MCDIYTAKCKCGEKIEMHLADYDTAPDEVEVFCQKCMPNKWTDGTVWKYRDSNKERWQKVFVRALTKNAMGNGGGNHPNAGYTEVVERPEGTLGVGNEMRM